MLQRLEIELEKKKVDIKKGVYPDFPTPMMVDPAPK